MNYIKRVINRYIKNFLEKYTEAIDQFNKGIELFLQKCDIENLKYVQKNDMQLASQLYTNRAICNHMLNKFTEVIDDTTFVLNRIDPQNAKALYRRGVALSNQHDYEKAIVDLEKAIKIDPNNNLIKEELNIALKGEIENRKKKVNEKKKTGIVVVSEDSKSPIETEVKKVAPPKPKKISEEQLSKVAAKAAEKLSNELFTKPATGYAFEAVWRTYKNEEDTFHKYLKVNANNIILIRSM